MVPLMGKPVLEHILLLLRESGVKQVCITLRYAPEKIREYFGDGRKLGMEICYSVEEKPLGTAGGVALCRDFLGQEDFFVISGDCVCDFDLAAAAAYHREKQSEATILLCSRPDPTAFGLACTNRDGRIGCFAEKPAWEAVFTDLVNAGIYVLSPKVLQEVPRGETWDFGKDLFPGLLRQGRPVFGYEAKGYWCDIGTPEAYLGCCRDILSGKLRTFPMPADGIFCCGRIPEGVKITPPVCICAGAELLPGASVGPYAVIGPKSSLAAGTHGENAVLEGCRLEENASVRGAVLCGGVLAERNAAVGEGAVVGRDCVLGEGASVLPGARIWPGQRIDPGEQVSGCLRAEKREDTPAFAAPGVLQGIFGKTLTPELCVRMGAAAADIGGRVGISWQGGEAARILAEAFSCGVCAGGGTAVHPDCSFEAQAAFAAMRYQLPVSAFFRQSGKETSVMFFGEDGQRIGREAERRMEQAAEDGTPFVSAAMAGSVTELFGVGEAYIREAARPGVCEGFSVAAAGGGPENRALQTALSASGAKLINSAGAAALSVLPGGFGLSAKLPDGRQIGPERLLMAAALTELKWGSGSIAVPYNAPGGLEELAEACGGRVLRLGRDGAPAEEMSLRQPFLRDGIFAAVQICACLTARGMRLSELVEETPEYGACRRVIPVEGDRAAVMRVLTESFSEDSSELVKGLRIFTGKGRVTVSPMRQRSAISVMAESRDAEAARELCGDLDRLIRKTAAEIKEQLE